MKIAVPTYTWKILDTLTVDRYGEEEDYSQELHGNDRMFPEEQKFVEIHFPYYDKEWETGGKKNKPDTVLFRLEDVRVNNCTIFSGCEFSKSKYDDVEVQQYDWGSSDADTLVLKRDFLVRCKNFVDMRRANVVAVLTNNEEERERILLEEFNIFEDEIGKYGNLNNIVNPRLPLELAKLVSEYCLI